MHHLRSGVQDLSTKNTKKKKISWAWWHTLVVSATWEIGAGESFEPRSNIGGKGCSETRSCHYIPAWATERDSVSKRKKKELTVNI